MIKTVNSSYLPHCQSKESAKYGFIESLTSTTLFAITAPFISPKKDIARCALYCLGLCSANATLRSFEPEPTPLKEKSPSLLKEGSLHVRASLFSLFYSATADTLLHEVGHASSARLFYKNASPCIQVYCDGGGATSYHTEALTRLGKSLSPQTCHSLTAAAGALTTFSLALAFMITAHYISENHPELAHYLDTLCYTSTVGNILYALSAFSSKVSPCLESSHDFLSLWAAGIHPLFFVTFFIITPLIIKHLLNNTKL